MFEAEDGHVALEFMKDYEANRKKYNEKFPPIIIFLDVNMPRVTGFEFLEQFQKLKEEQNGYEDCIFMMFTSSESEIDRKKAMVFPFVKHFLVKGRFSSEDLAEKIRQVFV